MAERWLPVVGFPGYEVSDQGRVRNANRVHRGIRRGPSTENGVLRPVDVWTRNSRGRYLKCVIVSLHRGGRSHARVIAALVLSAFVGPRPNGKQAAHWDANKRNNRLRNLRWATPLENAADALRHGHTLHGENATGAKLTASEVVDIRRRRLRGESANSLAAEFKVTAKTIRDIGTRLTWKSIA